MRKDVELIKATYPPGTRLRLIEMREDPCPVEAGTCGRVNYIDDTGTLHMKWDNGRTLGLIVGKDQFEIL